MTTVALAVCLVLVLAFCLDRLAMAGAFLFSDAQAEARRLQVLHLRLRFLKGVAREIGKTEAEIARLEAALTEAPDESSSED